METCGTITPSDAILELQACWESMPAKVQNSAQSALCRSLFIDIARVFPIFVSRDFRYLMQRFVAEGESFFFATLPALGKAFEASLITGEDLNVPAGWRLFRDTRLPMICHELWEELWHGDGRLRFDYHEHKLVTEKQVKACLFLRQLCLMWSKVEVKSANFLLKEKEALSSFKVRVSRRSEIDFSLPLVRDSLVEARRLLQFVFNQNVESVTELRRFQKNPWGRHGSGAVSQGERGMEKWSFNQWPGIPRQLFSWAPGKDMDVSSTKAVPPSRVCCVPKDFRGPRVICIEPKELQFAQQGIMKLLYKLSREVPLLRRSISYDDVSISKSLCYDYTKATIDMKDASDLILLDLGRLILPRWVFKLVTRYRSRQVSFPDGSQVKTTCMATMGNATCFPLETMIFWAISLGCMISLRDSHPKFRQLDITARIFGDDIIVPLWSADAVVEVLTACKMLVNTSKTCTYSLVRESCGEWVFANRPIPIFRLRSADVRDYRSLLQWRDQLHDLSGVELPALKEAIRSRCIDFVERVKTANKLAFKTRFNKSLQRIEISAPAFVQGGKRAQLTNYQALYAWHVGNDRTPFLKGTLKRVKMRWQDPHIWTI